MILTIIAILIILWLLGLFVHVGGALINILLIVALVVFLYDVLVTRRR